MQEWEVALNLFLDSWKDREDVIGVLVCGSYITGNPSHRSDIDVHIVLKDECDWRERGNQYVNDYLIEYFVNPPQQLRSYFKEDFEDCSTMSMVQWITGKVLLDKDGTLKQLVEEAREWKAKTFTHQSEIEITKYMLWDALDNLADCYDQKRQDFPFVYHSFLMNLFEKYSSTLQLEKIPSYQIYRYLTDPQYLTKYLKLPFPDTDFVHLFVEALTITEIDKQFLQYKKLTEHVLHKLGGFQIDGWKFKSPVYLV